MVFKMPILDFAKNAAGIFSEIEGFIHFYNSIPVLKDWAIDAFIIKPNYSILLSKFQNYA